jgi:hypothetical protein
MARAFQRVCLQLCRELTRAGPEKAIRSPLDLLEQANASMRFMAKMSFV